MASFARTATCSTDEIHGDLFTQIDVGWTVAHKYMKAGIRYEVRSASKPARAARACARL